jgi:hypothetical protein
VDDSCRSISDRSISAAPKWLARRLVHVHAQPYLQYLVRCRRCPVYGYCSSCSSVFTDGQASSGWLPRGGCARCHNQSGCSPGSAVPVTRPFNCPESVRRSCNFRRRMADSNGTGSAHTVQQKRDDITYAADGRALASAKVERDARLGARKEGSGEAPPQCVPLTQRPFFLRRHAVRPARRRCPSFVAG